MNRACVWCAYEIDAEPARNCEEHQWHDKTDPAFPFYDMCCKCGVDVEMIGK